MNLSPPSPSSSGINTEPCDNDTDKFGANALQNGSLACHQDLIHRNNASELGFPEDESLLGPNNGNEEKPKLPDGEKMDEVRQCNLITSMIVMSVSIMSYSIFSSTFGQWIYIRFQQEVMGANFSLFNHSAQSDPCHKGDNHTSPFTKQLNEAQSKVSVFNIYLMLISLLPALFTNIVIGAFADRIGRRFLFIVPMIGSTLRMACTCVVNYWKFNVYYLFIGIAVAGCCGDLPALFMGLYVYTADNTKPNKSRSFVMALAQTFVGLMFSLSNLVVGYFIDVCGYTWPMVLALGLSLVALVVCIFFLRETLVRRGPVGLHQLSQGIKDVFSFYLIQSKNPKYKRKDYVLLGAVFFLFGTCLGVSIMTLYVMNEPFCWSAKKIGIVLTCKGVIGCLVSIGALRLLQRLMSDDMICVLSLLSTTASHLVFAFAVNDWMMYIAFTVGILDMLVLPIIRATLSRMVPLEKRGSVFASIAVIEVATIVASGAGFDALYAQTVGYWHGLTYLVIGCCSVFAAVLMLLFIFIIRRREANIHTAVSGKVVIERPINSSINNGCDSDDYDDQLLLG